MQQVNFRDIGEFFEYLPKEELDIVLHIRAIIKECIPNIKEKLSYNVPYYYLNSRVCFLWPGSITWGNVKNKGVRLGFVNGNLMRDELDYLDKGNRKQVYFKDFFSTREIDDSLIKMYLFEAITIDSELKKRKEKK